MAVRFGTARMRTGASFGHCNGKYTGEKKCTTPYVTQDELEKAFVSVMQRMIREKDAIIAACQKKLVGLDTTELDAEVARLQEKATVIAERLCKLIEENARVRIDQVGYQREYHALANEYDRINAQIQAIEDRNRDKAKSRRKLEIFLGLLEKMEVCEAFEPYTFATMVEKVVVGRDGQMQFFFRNGMRCGHRLIKNQQSVRSPLTLSRIVETSERV